MENNENQSIKERLVKDFKRFYNDKNPRVFFAPGRVNLIGEYTDFNGGYVFPCTLSFGTYCLIAKRNDDMINFYSDNFPEIGTITIKVGEYTNEKSQDWVNYPVGVLKMLEEVDFSLPSGADIYYHGDIPNAAGLSSSASIEIVTAVAIIESFDFILDKIEMVKLCQKVENEFMGVNTGIMDQFAVTMGKKDNAILLDCNTLNYRYSHLNLEEYSLVVTNSNKRRGLTESKYNERRSQCEAALSDLQKKLDIKALGELDNETFEKNKHLIKDPVNLKRARHAVSENQRTLKAVEELENGNIEGFGKLMNQSHDSLKNDFEVTGKELDTLAELSQNFEGVAGSRMTGAGFGGCSVSFVKREKVEAFTDYVGKKYKELTGYTADFYIVDIVDGASEI